MHLGKLHNINKRNDKTDIANIDTIDIFILIYM